MKQLVDFPYRVHVANILQLLVRFQALNLSFLQLSFSQEVIEEDREEFLDIMRSIREPIAHLLATRLRCLRTIAFEVCDSEDMVPWWASQLHIMFGSHWPCIIHVQVPEKVSCVWSVEGCHTPTHSQIILDGSQRLPSGMFAVHVCSRSEL